MLLVLFCGLGLVSVISRADEASDQLEQARAHKILSGSVDQYEGILKGYDAAIREVSDRIFKGATEGGKDYRDYHLSVDEAELAARKRAQRENQIRMWVLRVKTESEVTRDILKATHDAALIKEVYSRVEKEKGRQSLELKQSLDEILGRDGLLPRRCVL